MRSCRAPVPDTMASFGRAAAREAVLDHPGPADHQLGQHPGRDLAHARVRRAAATSTPPRSTCRPRCCAPQRQLPQELTQLPSYRKVNPADAPVLLHRADLAVDDAWRSSTTIAENLISPTLSTIDGVAQVRRVRPARPSRCASRPMPTCSTARNITLDELAAAVELGQRQHAASACSTARARRSPSRPTGSSRTRGRLRQAHRRPAQRRAGAALDEVAIIEDSFEIGQDRQLASTARAPSRWPCSASPMPTRVAGGGRGAAR